MAEHEERPSDDWANHVAKVTFLWSMALAVATIGSVFVFILR